MDTFLQLPLARRLLAFQQVDEAMGLQAVSVEKDFWVCWTLRELFLLPGIGQHLTFKGGTSLSKAWKLIERFSEDIDIIVDKEVLGFGGEAAPDRAASNKQRKARLESLMNACREWVQGKLQPALASRIQSALGDNGWQLEVDAEARRLHGPFEYGLIAPQAQPIRILSSASFTSATRNLTALPILK
jgi:hypothetical protein